jgi:hypothetical protein
MCTATWFTACWREMQNNPFRLSPLVPKLRLGTHGWKLRFPSG